MLQDELKSYRIILASQSPRRSQLIKGLDIDFEILVREGIDELVPKGLDKFQIPLYLAEYKSEAYIDLLVGNNIVITADTIVWHNNKELGKPTDYDHAIEMLQKLSGSMHEVITGVCIRSKNQFVKFHSLSKVWFRKLSLEEINYYLSKYKPYDKAGSYGIQEWLGYAAIEKIDGSFYNVMGLPVQALYSELIDFIQNEKA
jgi:septum formation protein